jgi:hypothetical protein
VLEVAELSFRLFLTKTEIPSNFFFKMSTETKDTKMESKKRKPSSKGDSEKKSNKKARKGEKKKKEEEVDDHNWYIDVLVYGDEDGGDYPTVNFFDPGDGGEELSVVYKKALAAKGKDIKVKSGTARVISKVFYSYEEREAAYLFGRCVEEFYCPDDHARLKIELFRRDPPGEEDDYFNVEPCVDCRHFEKCEQVYCCGMEKFT